MPESHSIDTLNRLLAAEYQGLVPRLAQADPFVSMPAAGDRALLLRMAADGRAHERDLIEMIIRLRGAPVPRRFATESGGVHYIGLSHLIPLLIEDLRRLVAVYESAGATGTAEADALTARFLHDYRGYLKTLETMHGNLAPPPNGDGQVVETHPPQSTSAAPETRPTTASKNSTPQPNEAPGL